MDNDKQNFDKSPGIDGEKSGCITVLGVFLWLPAAIDIDALIR